ncbi:MAG: hypothetical protein ACYTGQ_14390, partial [Planctomycetota bacterium]
AAVPLALITPAAFYLAIKKQLIGLTPLAIVLFVGATIVALTAWMDFNLAHFRDTDFTLHTPELARHIASWLALSLASVFPVAAAPLALKANRHR